jgi:hypothetical protein
LDHGVEWINVMAEEIGSIEFEQNLMQLSVHGVSKEEIEKLRDKFKMQTLSEAEKEKLAKNELNMLRRLGGYVGKKSKTRVIR